MMDEREETLRRMKKDVWLVFFHDSGQGGGGPARVEEKDMIVLFCNFLF